MILPLSLLTLSSDFNPFLHGWTGNDGACYYSDGWRSPGKIILSNIVLSLTRTARRRDLYRWQLLSSHLPTHGPVFLHFRPLLRNYPGRVFVSVTWSC